MTSAALADSDHSTTPTLPPRYHRRRALTRACLCVLALVPVPVVFALLHTVVARATPTGSGG